MLPRQLYVGLMGDEPLHADDGQLLCDLRAGGQKGRRACAEVYRRYFEELLRRVAGMGRSVKVEDREEAVQGVFEHLCQGQAFCRIPGSLLAYLTSCARHRLANQLRAQRGRERRERAGGCSAENASCGELGPFAVLWAYERHEVVRQAVGNLPPKQRQALELVYFGGHSHDEAAELLHVCRRTIKRRCSAAMERLEHTLAGRVPERRDRCKAAGGT